MKNCEDTMKYLEEKLCEGGLTEISDSEVKEHLSSCASCSRSRDSMLGLESALTAPDADMPDEQYWAGYANKLHEKISRLPDARPAAITPLRRTTFWAAAAAVLVAFAYIYLRPGDTVEDAAVPRDVTSIPKPRFEMKDYQTLAAEYASSDAKGKDALLKRFSKNATVTLSCAKAVLTEDSYSNLQRLVALELVQKLRLDVSKTDLLPLIDDAELWRAAVDALVATEGNGLIEHWKALLRQGDRQQVAIYALVKTNKDTAATEIVKAYDKLSFVDRANAIETLSKAAGGNDKKQLHRLLQGQDAASKKNVLCMLGDMRDGSSVKMILPLVKNPNFKDDALLALVKIGDPTAIGQLAGSSDLKELEAFLSSLQVVAGKATVAKELVRLAGSGNAIAKRNAFAMLKVFGSADDAAELLKFAKDPSMARDVISLAGTIGDERSLPFLISMLGSGKYGRESVLALGELKTDKSIPVLIKALEQGGLQSDAYAILKTRTGEDFGRNPSLWMKWWEKTGDGKSGRLEIDPLKC